MSSPQPAGPLASSRRQFLKAGLSATTAAALATSTSRFVHAAEKNTIRLAMIGCGGRGGGAIGQAVNAAGDCKVVALADFFDNKVRGMAASVKTRFGDKVDLPDERLFAGLEAYRKAMDVLQPGDVVLLTAPPAFRALHLEYAVQKGLHVFMEKSFAVDAPGIRRMLRAGEESEKRNLKIATGLMWRHGLQREELFKRIHDGAIGEVIVSRAFRMHDPVAYIRRQPGMTELAHQVQNYSNFTWLNGSFMVDWLIHDIDMCCWAKQAWPVSAQGQGGRQVRTQQDQLYDHYLAEFTFPDGTLAYAQGRHMTKCYNFFGDIIFGTKGAAVMMESGSDRPRIYKGHNLTKENEVWRYDGPIESPYQREHNLFFNAIRNDKPYNETDRSVRSNMAAILGRMVCESGQKIIWDEALASDLELAPGLDKLALDSPAPVQPDQDGNYPIAMPGTSRVL